MITVKLTHPRHWLKESLPCNYLQQSPQNLGIWGNYKFEINNDCDVCDYWIVHGNLDQKETARVKYAHLFISSEEATTKVWDERFLRQFDYVITSQDAVQHLQLIRTQYMCAWQVDQSYDFLTKLAPVEKKKMLSTITSNSTWKEGHKKRFAFVNQLKGHFKNRLDWYGLGYQYIRNKWDGLVDYKYSIAIENSSHLHYWTEKIADCFLAYTMPIYFGCTNISDYFPKQSLILIDWNDLDKSVDIIEQALEEDYYTKNFEYLLKARDLVLNHYQFLPKVSAILSELPVQRSGYKSVSLRPDTFYTQKNIIQKVVHKLLS